MSNQQKLDHYLNEMTQETTNAGSEKPQPQPQPQQQKAAKPKVEKKRKKGCAAEQGR